MRSAPVVPRGRTLWLTLIAVLLAPQLVASLEAATSRGRFDRAPFYHGKPKGAVRPAGHLTVSFRDQPGSLDPTPDRSPALAALLDSLRVAIDRLGLTVPLAVDPRLGGGPDVRFGARRGGTDAEGMPRPPTEIDPTEPRRMEFEVEGPSRNWRRNVVLGWPDSVKAVITVQLGFDEHWVRQKNWRGHKAIELGEGREMPVPWLTSLDDPVQVLQLTGALVSREGKVLRVGAEGLIARRTGMTASVFGAQEVLTEDELATLISGDGEPVHRTALRALVAGLLGGSRTNR